MEYITSHWIEITGAIIGLLYLYYEYKVNILMWPTGIIMSLFYTVVYIQETFYAFATINIYYIIVGIYGWIQWHRSKSKNKNIANDLIRTSPRLYLPIVVTIVIIFILLVFILSEYTDSQVVYADSFVTALSIVAMIMLAKKHIEQWLLLIVLNFVSVFIYYYQSLYPTSIMYFVYAIVSVFGYLKWKEIAVDSKK